MKPIFVTATGTEIGKTYVACGVLRSLHARGVPAFALKPVLSGWDEGRPDESDTGQLIRAMGDQPSATLIDSVTPWRFIAPVSPDLAAAREGRTVSLDDVTAFCAAQASTRDGVCFIEGAGGVMSPMGYGFTNLDLACRLNANILLVAGSYLGAISHILSALEAIRVRQLSISTLVISESIDNPCPIEETLQSLHRFTSERLFVVRRGVGQFEEIARAIVP